MISTFVKGYTDPIYSLLYEYRYYILGCILILTAGICIYLLYDVVSGIIIKRSKGKHYCKWISEKDIEKQVDIIKKNKEGKQKDGKGRKK